MPLKTSQTQQKLAEQPNPEYMRLSFILPNQKNINIKATIVSITEPITVYSKKAAKEIQLQNALVTDESIQPKTLQLVLWTQYINLYKPGDKLEITNAYTTEWNNETQIRLTKTAEIKKTNSE